MANIREQSAPGDLGISPSDRGTDSRVATARRIGAFSNQVADALTGLGSKTAQLGTTRAAMWNSLGNNVATDIRDVGEVALKSEENKDISHGAAVGSEGFVNLEKQWNDIKGKVDPNDDSVAGKFKEEVFEPWAEKFKSAFTTDKGQQYAEGMVEKFRSHFDTKTAADMSTLAGIAAKQNATKTINSLSSAVYLDPSSLDSSIGILKHSAGAIVASSPTIDAETGARITSELNQKGIESLVKSAVSGMIAKNPGIDLDAIQKKYPEYINGAELKMFQKAAQSQAKVDAYHEKQAGIAQRQLDDLNVHKDATDTLTKNVSVDATGKPLVNPKFFKDTLDIARRNPDAPSAAATVRTMLEWGESQQNKELKVVDDPVVKADLMTRMFSADKPTTMIELMKARADGKISDQTFQTYHGLVQELEQTPLKGPIWSDTVAAVKGELVLSGVGIPGKDIAGESNYAKWAQTFIPQYLAQQRAGTLPPNALDVKDPTSLISQSMKPFKRDVNQRVNDYLSVLGAATPGQPARTFGGVPVPAALNGIASLVRNSANGQWRDETSGIVYDKDGREIKK